MRVGCGSMASISPVPRCTSGARAGIGYLAQEPSIFRKMTVEENILAILGDTATSDASERTRRLERMLDELSIKHLRRSRAYSAERR